MFICPQVVAGWYTQKNDTNISLTRAERGPMNAQELVERACSSLTITSLSRIGSLTELQMCRIIYLYSRIFSEYFVPILGTAYCNSGSTVARGVARENLLCEIAEEHPQMLRNFAAQLPAMFDPDSVRDAYSLADQKAKEALEIAQSSGFSALVMAAVLEGTSLVFVPALNVMARRLYFTNFEYIKKHGEADVQHAKALIGAVDDERGLELLNYNAIDVEADQQYAAEAVLDLLRVIFRVDFYG